MRINLLSGNLEKLYLKKKFHGKFDIGVLSIHSANYMSKEMSVLFKEGAKVHVESADYMVLLKPEQRVEFRKKMAEKAVNAMWKVAEEHPFKHHLLMEVHKEPAQ
jgi:hypothetical protein